MLKALWWAIGFLTVIPVGEKARRLPGRMGAVMLWFPPVGLGLGAISGGAALLAGRVLPWPVAALLSVLVYAALTRGLHLDGLADTLDGLLGGWTRERRLEIMRDSSVGTFGIMGIFFALALRGLALSILGGSELSGGFAWAPRVPPILAAWCVVVMLGRWSHVLSATISSYARAEGTGAAFIAGTGKGTCVAASIFPLAVSAVLLGWAGLIVAASTALVTLACCAWCERAIGGVTGDTLGAVGEIGEIAGLLVLLGVIGRV